METLHHDAADLSAWVMARDEAAFERLVARHAGLVSATCRRQLGRSEAADEACQAAFIVLARRASTVADPGRLGSWLYTVALRLCHKARRARSRRGRQEHAIMADLPSQRPADNEGDWHRAQPRLDEALASLRAVSRDAVIAFYLERLPQAEVARRLGVSEEAARKRIQVGVEKLRTWFQRQGIAVGAAALVAGIASESQAAEPALTAACAHAGLHPAAAGGAAALAKAGTALGVKLALGALALTLGVAAFAATTRAERAPRVVDAPRPAIARARGLDDLEGALMWHDHEGSTPIAISVVHEPVHGGRSALRLEYRPQPGDAVTYGEVSRPLHLRPGDRALRFSVLVESAEPGANWNVQFRQHDTTCWMIGGGTCANLHPGWNEIELVLPEHPQVVSDPVSPYDPSIVSGLLFSLCQQRATLVLDDFALVGDPTTSR